MQNYVDVSFRLVLRRKRHHYNFKKNEYNNVSKKRSTIPIINSLLSSKIIKYSAKILYPFLRRILTLKPIINFAGTKALMPTPGVIYSINEEISKDIKRILKRHFGEHISVYSISEVYKNVNIDKAILVIEPSSAWPVPEFLPFKEEFIISRIIPDHSMFGIFSLSPKALIDERLLKILNKLKFIKTNDILSIIMLLINLPLPSYSDSYIKNLLVRYKYPMEDYLTKYKLAKSLRQKRASL